MTFRRFLRCIQSRLQPPIMNHFDFQPPLSVTLSNRPASSRGGVGGHRGGGAGGGHPRGGPPHVKATRSCTDVMCSPCVIFLLLTLALTSAASFLLSVALTSRYWEMMIYDSAKIDDIIHANDSFSADPPTLSWLFDGKLPVITYAAKIPPRVIFLLPIHSGVWISCIDLTEPEFEELQERGYEKPHCVDHLQPQSARTNRDPEVRASWQHRMQNLAIACAMVCLILQGAAIPVGLFGTLRRQISAVLVTGVIYILSALFALFTLTIVHLKHKNRNDYEPLDIWTRLIPDHHEFQTARVIFHGWSLQLGWAGSFVCVLAALMWIVLSKIMRYSKS